MPTPQKNQERYFTRTVTVPRRDSDQNPINGPDGQPVVDHTLGNFTFRRPTVLDLRDIGIRRAQSVNGVTTLDPQTSILVEIYAVFPHQVQAAPAGWNWEEQYEIWDLFAVYQAYVEGLQQYGEVSTKPKPKADADDEHPSGIGDDERA